MRILHVIHSVEPRTGGPIEAIKHLAGFKMTRGHVIEVASLNGPEDACVKQFPFTIHALGPGWAKYGYSPRLLPWLKQHAPDYNVVVVNGIWQYSSFAVWRALRTSTVPYFVFTHGMLDPWFKRQYPLKHLKKWLYWPWAEYRVLRNARGVCFTCEEERRLARESFWLYQCREVVVGYGTRSPSGDAEQQRARFFEAFPELKEKRLWLFLGRIHPKKGCDLLLRAFAQVAAADPSSRLVVAGPDQIGWQAELRRLSETLGIADRVNWPDMLQGDLKWGAFRAAEVFILPSHQENFGIAVAEALACKVPVLISNQINIWREIESDGAGLVEPDDLDGTQRLCARWLALGPAQRAKMRENALACFKKRFQIEQVAERLLRILQGRHGNGYEPN